MAIAHASVTYCGSLEDNPKNGLSKKWRFSSNLLVVDNFPYTAMGSCIHISFYAIFCESFCSYYLSFFALSCLFYQKVLNCENYFRTQINPVRNLFQLFYFKNEPTSSISDITVYKTYSYNTFREENSLKNIKAKETNDIFFFFALRNLY